MSQVNEPRFCIYVANSDHTRWKLFKANCSEHEALEYCSALKRYGLDTDVEAQGEGEPAYVRPIRKI